MQYIWYMFPVNGSFDPKGDHDLQVESHFCKQWSCELGLYLSDLSLFNPPLWSVLYCCSHLYCWSAWLGPTSVYISWVCAVLCANDDIQPRKTKPNKPKIQVKGIFTWGTLIFKSLSISRSVCPLAIQFQLRRAAVCPEGFRTWACDRWTSFVVVRVRFPSAVLLDLPSKPSGWFYKSHTVFLKKWDTNFMGRSCERRTCQPSSMVLQAPSPGERGVVGLWRSGSVLWASGSRSLFWVQVAISSSV